MKQFPEKNQLEEAEGNSPADLLFKFLPYWPFFILLLIISLSGAWIYLRYSLPVYQTTASLLIKQDKQGNADPLEAFDIFNSAKIVENETRILQSKALMQEVVKNLRLYAPVTIMGRILNQSAYVLSPIEIEAKCPDSLAHIERVYFDYDKTFNFVTIQNKKYLLNQWVNTPFGIVQFLPNKYYQSDNDKEIHFYFSLVSVKKTANQILNRLKIAPSGKQSTVIDLTIEDEVSKRSEDILNELIRVYNQAAVLDKNVLAGNTLKFVEDRLKYVVNELDSVEQRLQNYKSTNKIVDVSSQGQIFLQTVAANDQRISDVNMQLAVLEQVQNYVAGKEGMDGIVPATLGVSDPILTDLLQKLSDLQLQYFQTKKIVPENNPSLIALQSGIDKLKPGILDNIKSQRTNLIAGRNDLEATNNKYTSILRTIPQKERELLSISRQQAIKNNIYTFLLQKREDAALSFASTVADSRTIDRAESSDGPVGPKKVTIYLIAIGLALAVGIAFILVKDLLTRSVQQRSDIEKYTDIPFLGEVVYDRSKSSIVIAEGKRSFIAEQFRQLRTSLSYLGVDETHKKILITSNISGEGKSFIAINLGISLSLMDKKVILVELDLRKPKMSDQFNVSRNTGITNYLIGKMQPQELVRDTGIENLSLLPSGPIPPNPSELISNGHLTELLVYLESTFDYIIVDTAPTNPVTDAFILSPLCDVTLYVIRHAYTPKIFIQKLEQLHKKNSLKNLAIVYNGIKGKGFGKYGYGYGYGYGYRYGYGYTQDSKNKKGWRSFFKA